MSGVPVTEELYIEQDGDQFNDLWLACAVIFGVLFGFFLGVMILGMLRKKFPAMYTKADATRLAESGLQREPNEDDNMKPDDDTYSEIIPPDQLPATSQVGTAEGLRPLSWVRRKSTVDLGTDDPTVQDGLIDALSQDSLAQMQLAVSSQDFQTVIHWETELQVQYRNIFLNLINIYLDSLVQQKIIDEPQRNAISKNYTTQLKEVEQEWNSKLQNAIKMFEAQTGGDSMQCMDVEKLRYDAAMDFEVRMIKIREALTKELDSNTTLKAEEIEFMEEKLISNVTMTCEIINAEYISISKSKSGRYDIIKKSAIEHFATREWNREEVVMVLERFKKLANDLKALKVSGSVISKAQKTVEDRVNGADKKFDEEYNQQVQDILEKCARDRVQEMKKIKSWKRSTEIASTSNQSYQAAVDGLIEPSRYIQTIHELQKSVRLDRMLASNRMDAKEGEYFSEIVLARTEGKQREYKAIMTEMMDLRPKREGIPCSVWTWRSSEALTKELDSNTTLKAEEIEFMEEKLISNVTMTCEIINAEYISISKSKSGRYDIIKKSAIEHFATREWNREEVVMVLERFKKLANDLKALKVSGSVISKAQKTVEDRVNGADKKFDEEYNQQVQDILEKCARDRVQEMKKIKSWKRSTEIASTSNQSYQAAVDGLIEPSRYIQTIHELQKSVRLDRMLASNRMDAKEGEYFSEIVLARTEGKQREYKAIMTEMMDLIKQEKGVDVAAIDQKFRECFKDIETKRKDGLNEIREEINAYLSRGQAMKDKLDSEMHKQSADQEELLGEQEDAVAEVLQTQSGLTEQDREHMMSVHQHQALSVINMLFMSRIRAVKRLNSTIPMSCNVSISSWKRSLRRKGGLPLTLHLERP
eukprot:sb/3461955/